MVFSEISHLIVPAIIFSIYILIGNPIIMMALMGYFGYSRNTGFMTGLTVAQISEFSLILIALGVKVGHIPNEILSFVTVIGLLTIAGSTYMIMYSDKLYSLLHEYLGIFERKKIKEKNIKNKEYEYILLGENRIGFSVMNLFKSKTKNYVIVDFNPERVKRLKAKGIHAIYGDVSSAEFLEDLKIGKAKIVVSTIPEMDVNMLILNKIREKNKKAIVMVTSRNISDTFELYNAGANYVILPHFLGGEYTSNLIEKAKENPKIYESEKNRQLKDLKERLKEGQKHPEVEKD